MPSPLGGRETGSRANKLRKKPHAVTRRPPCAWRATDQPDLQPDEKVFHFQTSAQAQFFSITIFKKTLLYKLKSLSPLCLLPEALGFGKPAIPQADLTAEQGPDEENPSDLSQSGQSPAQHHVLKLQQAHGTAPSTGPSGLRAASNLWLYDKAKG